MDTTKDFFVRFWGVRGSIPCPGAATARYGGNTACLEIECGGRTLLFDAGTGLYQYGQAKAGAGPVDIDLYLTHCHYDHVWGWSHFPLGLQEGNTFRIHGGHLDQPGAIKDIMMGLLDDPLNPLNTDTLRAKLDFEEFAPGDVLSPAPGVNLRTMALNHPNGAIGYRVEYEGRSICYLTDHEHPETGNTEAFIEFARGANIVIYDSTYTDEEYPNHVGWGHSTWQEGVRLCEAAEAETYVVFHHDPGHDDDFMDGIARAVEQARPKSVVAREGLVLRP